MPLMKQTTVYSYSGDGMPSPTLLPNKQTSFDEIVPSISSTSNTSSWKLLRKLFGESRSLSLKSKDEVELEALNRKSKRRVSYDAVIVEEGTNKNITGSGMRRMQLTRQRKISNQKFPSTKSARKFSAVNSQENLLHYFVSEGDISTLENILQNSRVDINFMRPPGLSPLHQACALGSSNVVELLINNGADMNLKTWSGLSPLQITTLFGHFEVAQILINNGADAKEIQDGFSHDIKLMSSVLVCMQSIP